MSPRQTAGMPVRVLAVDDDPQALRYVRDALTKAGYAPTVTGDPDDVPRLMAEEKPHLVLLDLVLPGSDGMELMRDILQTADVPIIFLSVYGQDEVVARALDTGAADYLVKPFLADGAGRAGPGGPAESHRARRRRAVRTLFGGRSQHRLRPTPGDDSGAAGAVDGDGVRSAL